MLQAALNPGDGGPEIQRFGWTFRIGDRVIQTENDYNRDVFNGDLGIIEKINRIEQEMVVNFEGRQVEYDFGDLDELALAYVLSIHKSQGSEFPCVVIPVHTQHYMMLQRNLLYTAVTRGKKLVVLVGHEEGVGDGGAAAGHGPEVHGVEEEVAGRVNGRVGRLLLAPRPVPGVSMTAAASDQWPVGFWSGKSLPPHMDSKSHVNYRRPK